MRVLQTTLLTGPYDWSEAVLPRAEFDARLRAVRAAVSAAGAGALIVHGYAGDYGALNYLTGFVPKLGPALALVPPEGGLRLIVSGTELMLPQAKLLTWVEDVRPFANVPKLVTEWLGERKGIAVASWGGAGLVQGLYRGITGAAGPLTALDGALDPIRRRKSPRELELMRAACGMLDAATKALAIAARGGAGARAAAIAAERAAIGAGAQDARALVSVKAGGTPAPVDSSDDPVLDPLLATVAVQHAGYWAEGSVTIGTSRGPALAAAQTALTALLREARAGASGAALLRAGSVTPLAPHPAMAGVAGHAIGLSLDEGPRLDGAAVLEPGATYALRVGARGAGTDAALLSALVLVKDGGAEILWRA
jgi:Xaa-Pro aminopeptidase